MMIEKRGLTILNSHADVTEHNCVRAVNADIRSSHHLSVALPFSRSPYHTTEEEMISWASWSRSEPPSLKQ